VLLARGLPARPATPKQGAGQIQPGAVSETVPKGYTPN
jgi:hypothetical protein